jgi:hypothetical protein
MRQFLIVVNMRILNVELLVFGIIHSHHAIFNDEGILVVFTNRRTADFDGPTRKIFTIENGSPFVLGRFFTAYRRKKDHDYGKKQ